MPSALHYSKRTSSLSTQEHPASPLSSSRALFPPSIPARCTSFPLSSIFVPCLAFTPYHRQVFNPAIYQHPLYFVQRIDPPRPMLHHILIHHYRLSSRKASPVHLHTPGVKASDSPTQVLRAHPFFVSDLPVLPLHVFHHLPNLGNYRFP